MFIITIMLITAAPAFAQEELTPFEQDVQDVENEAPIDGYIYLGLALSLIIGYKAVQKKKLS